jgi:MFS-type transporter involved in bile tolerance (Atg22 family)
MIIRDPFCPTSSQTTSGILCRACHVNVLYQVCPAERRATSMGIYITVMQFGAFAAPLAVAPLADLIGTQALVLVLGGLRLIGATLFVVNPVRAPQQVIAEPA